VIAAALKRLFVPDMARQHAHEAYVRIVAQSRQPRFFSEWKVPDTMDGRFDAILLHLSLVIARMEQESQDADVKNFVRLLSEVFFSDMDQSLRELGASDTGVGIRVKKMAQAFYGRLKAYGDALAAKTGPANTSLGDAIMRNMYRERAVDSAIIDGWNGYCTRNSHYLASQPLASLLAGEVLFLD